MSTPGLTFPFGPGAVTVTEDGRISRVVAEPEASTSYLTGGPVIATLAGRIVEWSIPSVAADVDEIEFGYGSAGELRLLVRHAFTSGWGVRIVLTNAGDADLELSSCVLTWEPRLDHPAWALAAGVTGAMAIQPPGGGGPLLGGRLTMGTCAAAGPDGLQFGPLSLARGGRYVLAWQWDWYRTARAFDQGSAPSVPRRFYLPVDHAVSIASDPDEAVVAEGLHVEPVRGQLELSSAVAGRFAIAVNSARGVTRYAVDWVDPREVLLEAAAVEAMAQPTTGAGLVRLADVDAALVVQWAVIRGSFAHPYPAEDALEVFAAGMAETESADPRLAGFLC
ncbi:MAG TPA: hypothetical protein VLJ88_07045, partial [Propionibacteriaceae bacterium]|nr:hypothetical protein [Propionibacteriaceae bacterium]